MEYEKQLVIVDSDLIATDAIITQLDNAIQNTGNLELSKQLNEISDSFEAIRKLMKIKHTTEELARVNENQSIEKKP
jgi:hypothetical protein